MNGHSVAGLVRLRGRDDDSREAAIWLPPFDAQIAVKFRHHHTTFEVAVAVGNGVGDLIVDWLNLWTDKWPHACVFLRANPVFGLRDPAHATTSAAWAKKESQHFVINCINQRWRLN